MPGSQFCRGFGGPVRADLSPQILHTWDKVTHSRGGTGTEPLAAAAAAAGGRKEQPKKDVSAHLKPSGVLLIPQY